VTVTTITDWSLRADDVTKVYKGGVRVTEVAGPFLVVGVWALLGTGLTAWAVGRRH